jgi:NAD(P)-dependent dehydrogenase (short-subunit alcohol dehydrogenase family)
MNDGWTVVLAGRRADPLHSLVADAAAQGKSALAVPTDVTDPASVQALFDTIERSFCRLDLLFNKNRAAASSTTAPSRPPRRALGARLTLTDLSERMARGVLQANGTTAPRAHDGCATRGRCGAH